MGGVPDATPNIYTVGDTNIMGEGDGSEKVPHKVDRPEAPMSNLVQVTEHVLRVIFEEEISQLRVLHRPFPRRRRHHWMHMGYAERRALTHTLMLAPPDVHDGHHRSTIGQLNLEGEGRTVTHTSRG